MDIVSSRFHQPGLAARLFLLLAFCLMGVTHANAAVASGEWQSASDLSIAQGDRFYDRSLGAYYTYNTVTASGGENLSGDLRLVVLSSSHSVLNADGVGDDGKPFFMVSAGSAENVVRINFQRRRAAFSYTTQMQRFVEQEPDSDGDGVVDAQDSCPNTPQGELVDANGCSESQKDDDSDGVNNVADQCPNTPAGETVDTNGCSDSQKDDDNDGVTNAADSCPNTPSGEAVDATGCSESQKDDDNDGIVNSDDFCPEDINNACFSIDVMVRGGGSGLQNAAVVVGIDGPGGATTSSTTNVDGHFVANVGHPGSIGNDGLDNFFPISAAIDGFATGFAKVLIAPDVFDYEVIIDLAPVSDIIGEDEDVTAGVIIDKADEKVGELMIPQAAFPTGVTAITGQITYLDPETDIDLAPGGDLLALPEGANPNDTPVPLETFGMMEFDLVDQNGNPVTELAAPAEVCMKAGGGLVAGDTVPLWYYDDELGLWIEEGQGMVESRDGQLLICGAVNHFSWWNYDQPINTHSCFKYHFIDGNTGDSLREQFDWFAEGVTYSGTSPERLCDRDGDDPATPAPGDGDIDSLTVKRTTDTSAPEQIRVTTTIGGNKYYLVDDGDGTYSLSTGVLDGAIFDNPMLNASCLNNTNVSDCLFLDYKEGADANGILPLDIDINLPPAITDFSSDLGQWGDLTIGASTNISALVTDLEGSDVTIGWTAQCSGTGADNGVLTPAGDIGSSGSSFTGQFMAPPALSQFYAYCELVITATDAQGNSSTASHWLRIVDPTLSFTVQGVVYGTDGLPLPFQSLELTDWSCDNPAILSVQTDENGAYTLDASGGTCSGEGYSWQLYTTFEHDSRNWEYYSDLSSCLDGAIEGDLSQTLVCERDIHLPTVWAPMSGVVHGSTNSISLDFQVSDYPWAYIGTFLEHDGSAGYGPVRVPVSSYGWGYIWDPASNTSSYRSFQVLSTEGVIVDFGLASGTATITAYDNDGAPLTNATVTGWVGEGVTAIDASLDEFGQLQLIDVPLGRLWLTVTAADGSIYYGYGILNVADEHIDIDINSPDSCVISGVAYDLFGQVAPGVDITAQAYSGNSWSTSTTVSDGVGAFSLTGRFSGGYNYIYQGSEDYWSGYNTINNCRPDETGNPPVIRIDVPERNNADYLLN